MKINHLGFFIRHYFQKAHNTHMNTLTEPNIIVKDHDGHKYSIPPHLHEDFKILNEATIMVECGSDEWFDAHDTLNDHFGQYMKGDS